MSTRNGAWALLLPALLGPSSALAQGWETVGTGVEYRQFTLPDPNNLFVARMDRSNLQVTIESSIATGKLATGTETVRSQAARYDQAISYWGQACSTWLPLRAEAATGSVGGRVPEAPRLLRRPPRRGSARTAG